ncbi:MAG: hypothetical protein KatS3mg130_0685 [Candidatus Sumerlaea sp.]|nr:MAG: hypothetical protein KatS3mg130_0685 [Candidatus Sumerlaea sp.]
MEFLDITEKLQDVEHRFNEIERSLSDPTILADPEKLRQQSKLHNELGKIVAKYRECREIEARLADARSMVNDPDPDLAALARAELEELEPRREALLRELQVMLLPKDPLDEKKHHCGDSGRVQGGEEAALFAADLFRMYTKIRGVPGMEGGAALAQTSRA